MKLEVAARSSSWKVPEKCLHGLPKLRQSAEKNLWHGFKVFLALGAGAASAESSCIDS
ncbi:hypothetical protein [Comamonas jiangduensis]|uniref:hypothetical protein n=1 Tax=Comamonas jiangduensis TaxID=1194168 RepID=UPI0024E0F450|nr:hypothetical protein [Comamonas jiangduensis]